MKQFCGRAFIACLLVLMSLGADAQAATCSPTEPDMLGPFYKPDAPVRSSVGKGYILQGTVRSSRNCRPVGKAKIEFWLVGPDGEYDDAYRATIIADAAGSYRFESNVPQPYGGRPPHIHIRVSAEGFNTLVTQHYPEKGKTEAVFDLVLVPVP
jgi:protocatechuate 3,4-dioxygenase beta subunit